MDKKKIALIPLLYNEYNYGGILQFYALQKKINDLGYTVNILRVSDDSFIFKPKKTIKSRILFVFKPYFWLKRRQKKRKINRLLANRFKAADMFKKQYYNLTVVYRKNKLIDYYAFVCGSDQIWNPNHPRKRAFLDFVPLPSKKIIYAASLGTDKLEKWQEPFYEKYINRIQFVSVRELSAKKILDSFLNRDDIKVVADPTLLLSADEWLSISEKRVFESPYVFVYLLGNVSLNQIELINEFASRKGLKIVRIPYASGETSTDLMFGDEQFINASPQEFLSLIKYSSYVISDSFHACVFSIIFHKEFYVFKRNGSDVMMDRIVTLFNFFGISSNRIVASLIPDLPFIDYKDF